MKRALLHRAAGGTLMSLFLIVAFASALVVGGLLHANLCAGRRVVESAVNRALGAETAVGTRAPRVRGIGRIGLGGVHIAELRIPLPDDQGGLVAQNVAVRYSLLGNVIALATRYPWRLRVVSVDIGDLDVHVREPESRAAGGSSSSPLARRATNHAPAGRAFGLAIDDIVVRHARVEATLSEWPTPLRAEMEPLRARVAIGPSGIDVHGEATGLVRGVLDHPLHIEMRGNAEVPTAGPVGETNRTGQDAPRAELSATVAYADSNGAVRLTMDGRDVDAKVELPRIAARDLRAHWPEIPFPGDLTAAASVRGSFPDLVVEAAANVRAMSVGATGTLHATPPFRTDLSVEARGIDMRAWVPSAPSSRLMLKGRLRGAVERGRPYGTFAGELLQSRIAGRALPRVAIAMRANARSVDAGLFMPQAGASVRFRGERTQAGAADMRFEARVPRLRPIVELASPGALASGSVAVHGQGTVDHGEVRAAVAMDGFRIHAGDFGAGAARVDLLGTGTLDAPRISGCVRLIALAVGPVRLTEASLHARGDPHALHLEFAGGHGTFERILGRADLRVDHHVVELRDTAASIARGGRVLDVQADALVISKTELAVVGLRVGGLGSPIALSLYHSRDRLYANVAAPRVGLQELSEFVGLRDVGLVGSTSLDLALDATRDGSTVTGHAALEKGALGPVHDLHGTAKIEVVGQDARADARLAAPAIGEVSLRAEGVLGGDWVLLDEASLGRTLRLATGSLVVQVLGTSPEEACKIVHCAPSLAAFAGKVGATVTLARPEARGADDGSLRVALVADDASGRILDLAASARFPWEKAVEMGKLPESSRVDGTFSLAPRALDQLPEPFRPKGLLGIVGATGLAAGTVSHPVVSMRARLSRLRAATAPRPMLDGDLLATYELGHGSADLNLVSARSNVGHARILFDAASPAPGGWSASLDAELRGLPLGVAPALAERGAEARAWGSVSLQQIHANPTAYGHILLDGMQVHGVPAGTMTIDVATGHRRGVVAIEAHEPLRTGPANGAAPEGVATLRANAAISPSDGLLPSFDWDRPVDARADWKRFSLTAVSAFLPWENRHHIGGMVDGSVHVHGIPGKMAESASAEDAFSVEGDLSVQEGRVVVPLLGREVADLTAHVTADGSGSVRAEQVKARIGGGSLRANASLVMRGTTFERGQGVLDVDRATPVPLSIEGVSYGTGWGHVETDAHAENGAVEIRVVAPQFQITLPNRDASTVESLAVNPAVVVLQPLGPPATESPVSAAAMTVRVVIDLGDRVAIRRRDMQADISGALAVTDLEQPRVDGTIRVRSGRFTVAGRTFGIERGVVEFAGSPTEPALDIEASYRTPEGTRIVARVGGTPSSADLTLTSDPPRSESEILSLLLFGEPVLPGQMGVAGPGVTIGQSAASGETVPGSGGAALAFGVNQLLGRSDLPVQTEISAGPYATRASAAVEVSQRVRVEYTRQFGTPLYGLELDSNLVSLDWRFATRWVLRTILGDRGTTSLDVLWQRWY